MRTVKRFTEHIDRLEAEESLLMAERMGVGTGAISDQAHWSRIVGGWRDAALPDGHQPPAARPTTGDLAAMGIKVIAQPREG